MSPHKRARRAPRVCAALALTALAALTGLASCAEERPPIDRVQPLALKKAFFIGDDFKSTADDPEFWTQGTLIDVGYGAAQDGLFTSTYAQPTSRIKWQITEDLLIGRIAYERIQDSDGKGIDPLGVKTTQDGVIVAAFRIESHFDIINAYNSTTGEQLNIRQEDSIDRPWYEREYFRVDWSQNLNMDSYDFDTLSMLKIYGGLVYEPLKYDITDPNDADAPVFDWDGGYFDVTVKAFVKPGEIDLSHLGWGINSFPSCYLDADFMSGSAPSGSCNPVELTIRHSFRRVVDTDYQPVDYDGLRFSAFGAFDHERTGYARNYGMVDAKWRRFMHRYNIWQRSHYYDNPEEMTGWVECGVDLPAGEDANKDANNDGTADACAEVGPGSQCDIFRQRCTLPYREREVRPVVWYFTNDSNTEYFDGTDRATHEWDGALRLAVRSAQYTECIREEENTCKAILERDVSCAPRPPEQNPGQGQNQQAPPVEEMCDEVARTAQRQADFEGCVEGRQALCVDKHPVHFGQQDLNEDLNAVSWEMKRCLKDEGYATSAADSQACLVKANRVAERRGLEGADKDAIVSLATMDPVVVLCHSPVHADDHPYCGDSSTRLPAGMTMDDCQIAQPGSDERATCEAALKVRMGDLRYHQVNVIKIPQTPSPWGIMVDATDSVTGETISASINVWSHVNDLWSQKVVDTLRFMKGELTAEEVTEGQYISDWAAAAESANGGSLSPKLTKAERDERLIDLAAEGSELTPEQVESLRARVNAPMPAEAKAQLRDIRSSLKGIKAHIEAPSENMTTYANRAARAQGTEVEAELFDSMVQQLMGVEGLPASGAVLDHASLLRGGNPAVQRQVRQLKEVALAERGACVLHEAPAPHGYGALADFLEAKFGAFNRNEGQEVQLARAEKMKSYLARRAHYAVIIHEMGHSVSLRHNFVSSSDAFNYRPQYWQLRTKNGTVTDKCEELDETGERCVGPRYFDPVTREERDNGIWMWMHSSVMDYAGEPTQDMLGLGAYDFAAARAFYGDVFSVYRDPSFSVGDASKRAVGVLDKMDNFGGITGFTWDVEGTTLNHYSELNGFYELIKDCKNVVPDSYKPSDWDDERDGRWHPTLDGLVVNVNGSYSRCRQQPVDYRFWGDMRMPETSDFSGFYQGGNAISKLDNRVRVPYGFGTDGWADLGNLSVYRHDNGADPYELFDFFISQQEVNHIFDNYRRNRLSFSIRGAAGRNLERFNTKMRDGAKGIGLFRSIYKTFAVNSGVNPSELWVYAAKNFFEPNMLAAGVAFDHFTRQLARPQQGPHLMDDTFILRSQQDASGLEEQPTAVVIPNGATGLFETVGIGGRPLENGLADDKGEYNSRYTINAGSYYEKLYSSMLMTESVDNFISSSRTDFLDGRFRSISMADLFPEGYRRWLANNLTNDAELKGPRLRSDRDGNVATNSEGYPTSAIGWTSWWGSQPRACFAGAQATLCDTYGAESQRLYGDSSSVFTVAIDPQVGWEQQKFLIAWTMMYLPENQQQWWIDLLRLWEFGKDADPAFERRIELHHPEGKSYVAKTFGKEEIFGKTVQRGVAARVLEYANDLMAKAYVTTDGPDLDGDGEPDWVLPTFNEETGRPVVRFDPGLVFLNDFGGGVPAVQGCGPTSNDSCTCDANRACLELRDYMQVPFFLRQTMDAYGFTDVSQRGVW